MGTLLGRTHQGEDGDQHWDGSGPLGSPQDLYIQVDHADGRAPSGTATAGPPLPLSMITKPCSSPLRICGSSSWQRARRSAMDKHSSAAKTAGIAEQVVRANPSLPY